MFGYPHCALPTDGAVVGQATHGASATREEFVDEG